MLIRKSPEYKLYLSLANHKKTRFYFFLFFFCWCHRNSLINVTRHCCILFLSALRSSFQLRKLSKLVTRNQVMLSKSAFFKQFSGWNILEEGMTVITCFEMPLGFRILMALMLCWYFCKCASLLLVTAGSINLGRTQFMKGPAISN